jgi:hypothetical protein
VVLGDTLVLSGYINDSSMALGGLVSVIANERKGEAQVYLSGSGLWGLSYRDSGRRVGAFGLGKLCFRSRWVV